MIDGFDKLPGKFYRREDKKMIPISHSAVWNEPEIFYQGRDASWIRRGENNETLWVLSQVPNLVGLDLTSVFNCEAAGYKHFAKNSKLKELKVSSITLDIHAAEAIAQLPYLETLFVSGYFIDPMIFQILTKCPRLRHLVVDFIDDGARTVLELFSQVESISFTSINTPAKDYQAVAQLPSLKTIYTDKYFAKDELEKAKADLDHLKIIDIEEARYIDIDRNRELTLWDGRLGEAVGRGIFYFIMSFLLGLVVFGLNKLGIIIFIFAILAWIQSFYAVLGFALFIGGLGAVSGLLQNAFLNAIAAAVITVGTLYFLGLSELQNEEPEVIYGFLTVIAAASGGFGYWLCSDDIY